MGGKLPQRGYYSRMAYRPRNAFDGGLTVADHVGCGAGLFFFFTVGFAALFGVTWGEAHGPADVWTGWRIPFAWLAVAACTFVVYWGVKRLVEALRR